MGYRLDADGASVAYVPDNELGDAAGADPRRRDALTAFVAGADVLIHDAMYTDAEYAARRGWGHSTAAQAVRLAEDAGVRRLLLFHHDPGRTDDQVDAIVGGVRRDLRERGSSLEVSGATEGEALSIGGA